MNSLELISIKNPNPQFLIHKSINFKLDNNKFGFK